MHLFGLESQKKFALGSSDHPARELGKKMKKGKEEGRKITFKKGEKALKMHLFGL